MLNFTSYISISQKWEVKKSVWPYEHSVLWKRSNLEFLPSHLRVGLTSSFSLPAQVTPSDKHNLHKDLIILYYYFWCDYLQTNRFFPLMMQIHSFRAVQRAAITNQQLNERHNLTF